MRGSVRTHTVAGCDFFVCVQVMQLSVPMAFVFFGCLAFADLRNRRVFNREQASFPLYDGFMNAYPDME